MSVVINTNLSNKTKNISVITLVAFLLAFFLHCQHLSQPLAEQSSVSDYQDCHLCQQGVDSPPKPLHLTLIVSERFTQVIRNFIDLIYVNKLYASPQLRAPPFSW